jgi:hypothetical protein
MYRILVGKPEGNWVDQDVGGWTILLLFINCNWAYARWQCYKNWTYIQKMDIYSKETKHTTHKKNSISHKVSQYSTSATNRIQGTINRMQDTKHRKTTEYTETTKHES